MSETVTGMNTAPNNGGATPAEWLTMEQFMDFARTEQLNEVVAFGSWNYLARYFERANNAADGQAFHIRFGEERRYSEASIAVTSFLRFVDAKHLELESGRRKREVFDGLFRPQLYSFMGRFIEGSVRHEVPQRRAS